MQLTLHAELAGINMATLDDFAGLEAVAATEEA